MVKVLIDKLLSNKLVILVFIVTSLLLWSVSQLSVVLGLAALAIHLIYGIVTEFRSRQRRFSSVKD